MRWLVGVSALVLCLLLLCVSSPVLAETVPKERGLLITPPRQYLSAKPGKTTRSSITVANLTENPVDVTLSYDQFSVADYTYDYQFEAPKENWIKFEKTQVTLKKTESRVIPYDVAVPPKASPGGHYFTLFASMSPGEGKLVRAATVVYLTVEGKIIKQSTIEKESLPFVWLGGEIPYSIDVRNSGNTHFLIYVSGRLRGLMATEPSDEVAHVLLPGTVRTIKATIPPPFMMGIYQADYGYRDEDGHETRHQRLIIYAPPRFLGLIGLIGLVILLWRRYRPRKSTGF